MAWMPLNNHPTRQADVRVLDHDQLGRRRPRTGRTAISNGRLIGFTDNAPGRRTSRRRLAHLALEVPEPIANYLVENSIGNYSASRRHDQAARFLARSAAGITAAREATRTWRR